MEENGALRVTVKFISIAKRGASFQTVHIVGITVTPQHAHLCTLSADWPAAVT